MKIQELNVHNFRGIVDCSFIVNGKNFCVYGGNGTGKSSVADAIDFLLSGKISHMEGEGTQEVSLKKHAPHIGAQAQDSYVEATITTVSGKRFKVKRLVSSPEDVEIDDSDKDEFSRIEKFAQTGAYMLSRKQLLKYVISKKGDRAAQIQNLLGIPDVNQKLGYLKKSEKKIKDGLDEFQTLCDDVEKKIKELCENEEELNSVNAWRIELGASGIDENQLDNVTKNVFWNSGSDNSEKTKRISALTQLINQFPNLQERLVLESSAIEKIKSDMDETRISVAETKKIGLIQTGLSLLDNSGKCPLCEHQWDSEEILRDHLIERQQNAEIIGVLYEEYKKHTEALKTNIKELKALVCRIDKSVVDKDKCAILSSMIAEVDSMAVKENLGNDEFETHDYQTVQYFGGIEHKLLAKECESIIDEISSTMELDEKTKADSWNRLNEYKRLFLCRCEYKKKLEESMRKYAVIHDLKNKYDESQSAVLNALYEKIKDRFVEIYKKLHGMDESHFDAEMERNGTGVGLSVDFHEQGKFPPLAYHSEGHLDSMGIALFFALVEKLACEENELIVLDDVVMSVDLDHRLAFCDFIKEEYSEKQFLITTHDSVWEKYLESHQVISGKNAFSFTGWDIKLGPSVSERSDVWDECKKRAKEEDLNSAAHLLRREMELFFENVCNGL